METEENEAYARANNVCGEQPEEAAVTSIRSREHDDGD